MEYYFNSVRRHYNNNIQIYIYIVSFAVPDYRPPPTRHSLLRTDIHTHQIPRAFEIRFSAAPYNIIYSSLVAVIVVVVVLEGRVGYSTTTIYNIIITLGTTSSYRRTLS